MNAVKTTLINTWRGLVERRLWPVAVLLLAALVAVPVVLGAGDDADPAPAQAVAPDSAELAGAPIVAVASASEREGVRRVLGGRKDPFAPKAQPRKKSSSTETAKAAGDTGSDSAGRPGTPSGGAGGGTAGGGGGGVSPAPAGPPAPGGSVPTPPKTVHKAYSLTVRWGSSDAEELLEGDLERLHALPSPEEPVVIYLGLLEDEKTAVFMVDADATADGDGRCNPDPANCETLELRRGDTAFFDVEDESGTVRQYQLDLVKIHRKRTTSARAAAKARSAVASGGRRALRSLHEASSSGEEEPPYRYDKRSGLLERVGDRS